MEVIHLVVSGVFELCRCHVGRRPCLVRIVNRILIIHLSTHPRTARFIERRHHALLLETVVSALHTLVDKIVYLTRVADSRLRRESILQTVGEDMRLTHDDRPFCLLHLLLNELSDINVTCLVQFVEVIHLSIDFFLL